jgi:hypothetical protein
LRIPLVALCILAAPALAQQVGDIETPVSAPAPVQIPLPKDIKDATWHRHVGGYFRMTLGGGYLGITPSPTGAARFSSGAALFSASLGYAVAENWILAADGWAVASPANAFGRDASLAVSGLGLNITHYFMPANVYIAFVPSATIGIISNRYDVVRQTQVGFGARFALGKEWWVGDHWGLGLAAEGFFASQRERSSAQPVWTSVGGGLVFSATYN